MSHTSLMRHHVRAVAKTMSVALASGLVSSLALSGAPATAAPASRDARPAAERSAGVDAESSVSIDWYNEDWIWLEAPDLVQVDESRLTSPLPNWLRVDPGGRAVIKHETQFPWNAPSTFDIPYIWNDPTGGARTGVVHVTMSRMPSPPPADQLTLPPGQVSSADLFAVFGDNYMFQSLAGNGYEVIDVGGSTETRTFQPLNTEMAKYFTAKFDSTGELLTLRGKKDAPALPANYWTYDWFAVDYIASGKLADPTMADKYSRYNGGIYAEAARQLRFTKPEAIMGLSGPFGRFYAQRVRPFNRKAYMSRRIELSPSTFGHLQGVEPSSVRVRLVRTSPVFTDFKVRRRGEITEFKGARIVLELRPGHKSPKSTSFQYQLTARDRTGLLVKSELATVTFNPTARSVELCAKAPEIVPHPGAVCG